MICLGSGQDPERIIEGEITSDLDDRGICPVCKKRCGLMLKETRVSYGGMGVIQVIKPH